MDNIVEVIGLLRKIKDATVDAARTVVSGPDAARRARVRELRARKNKLQTKLKMIKSVQKQNKQKQKEEE